MDFACLKTQFSKKMTIYSFFLYSLYSHGSTKMFLVLVSPRSMSQVGWKIIVTYSTSPCTKSISIFYKWNPLTNIFFWCGLSMFYPQANVVFLQSKHINQAWLFSELQLLNPTLLRHTTYLIAFIQTAHRLPNVWL